MLMAGNCRQTWQSSRSFIKMPDVYGEAGIILESKVSFVGERLLTPDWHWKEAPKSVHLLIERQFHVNIGQLLLLIGI